ncbi:SgcJ/EcaC family oxidoreductase [Streptomyces sp. NPDC089799]|uniref:SgcJ/EcaC family oxidoreductase n=1 Tax=Streptomyces sp. NPDC089799 TaxID=3155066 RepID=UPI003440B0B7
MTETAHQDRPADTEAIHALLARGCAAWAAGDGAAYGAQFTPDGTDVTYAGTVYHGADEIGRAHQDLFDSFLKNTRLVVEITDLRFHGPDTAVAVTRGDVRKGGPKAPGAGAGGRLGKLATYTLVRGTDGAWRIAAVQKTRHKRLTEAFSFRLRPATRPAPHPSER